jgi:hypothetical protein
VISHRDTEPQRRRPPNGNPRGIGGTSTKSLRLCASVANRES